MKKFCKKCKTFKKTYLLIALIILFWGSSAWTTIKIANAADPYGFLDSADCNTFSGWACDSDNYAAPIDVHFYKDGAAGGGGVIVGAVTAGNYRGDLVSAGVCGGNGYHGFTFTPPASLKDGLPHSIYAYGINIPSGNNPQLSGNPKTFTCAVSYKSCGRCSTVNPCQYATWQVYSWLDCEDTNKLNVVYTANDSCSAICSSPNVCSSGSCVTPPPTCSNAGPDGWTTTATTGTQTVYAYGVSNATAVYFPTWSDVNGQDDLIWYPGTNLGGGTWKADINLASHPGIGTINVHVYLNNNSYSNIWCDTANGSRSAPPITYHCSRCGAVNDRMWVEFDSTDATCATVVPAGNPVTQTLNCTCRTGDASWYNANYPGVCSSMCSVCTYPSSWTNQGCNQGGCAATQMYQTKTASPAGCGATQTQCVADASCVLTNDASCVGITAPDSVTVGQSFSATVTMSNTGTKPWTTDASPHKLGSQNPQDNLRWGLGRVGLPSSPINSGQSATFNFTATTPTTPGTYPFDWKMVEDTIEWFGQTCSKTITVNAAPCTPSCGGCSVSCGGGTQTCTRADCSTYSQSCNTQACPLGNFSLSLSGSAACNSVSLSWTSSSGAQGYRILRGSPRVDISPYQPYTAQNFTDTTVSQNTTYPYQIEAYNASGTNRSNEISVTTPYCPPTVNLSGNPTSIYQGQSVTLSWSSANSTSCTASGGWSGAEPLNGSQVVVPLPPPSVTYNLQCSGPGGSTSGSTTINIASLLLPNWKEIIPR